MFSFLSLKFKNDKNIEMKPLLFIIFTSTATSLAQTTDPSEPPANYDITTLLNNSIAQTFRSLNSDAIRELIYNMETDNPIHFHTGVNYENNTFQNEFSFTGVNISVLDLKSVYVRHEFSSAEMTVFFPRLDIKVEGYLEATNGTIYAGFVSSVIFETISIIAIQQPRQLLKYDLQIYMNMTHYENSESNWIGSPWLHQDIDSNCLYLGRFQSCLIPESLYELERKIKETMPSLFLYNLKHNEKFLRSLDAAFCNHPEKEIVSLYPDFKNNTERFHYFIPNITSLQRTLRNITILGLWNFQFHSFNPHLSQTVTNLTIRNIRGYANLSYDTQNLAIFPLRFEAGLVSILVDRVTQRVSVKTFNYSVSQIDLNSTLTEHQSKWVMEGIELAIASSIMPSLRIYRTRSESSNTLEEHPIIKMSTIMSQQFEGKNVQKLYDDWNISIPENTTATVLESNLQLESSIYNISVNFLSQFLPGPYSNLIECNLYNTLNITFALPWYLDGTIRLSNMTHTLNDIDFVKDGNIISVLVKSNNSNDNDFELVTAPHVYIHLTYPNTLNFPEDHLKAIVEKTEKMLESSFTELIMFLAKPLVSLPLDYCTAPAKLFDDFLPFFSDEELPYHVPNHDKTEQFFTPKVNNVVIEDWTKTPKISVMLLNFFKDVSIVQSIILTELGMTKIRMNFNHSSVQSGNLEIVFSNTVLRNYTYLGEMTVEFLYDSEKNPARYNPSLSASESYWLNNKLEHIVGESF